MLCITQEKRDCIGKPFRSLDVATIHETSLAHALPPNRVSIDILLQGEYLMASTMTYSASQTLAF